MGLAGLAFDLTLADSVCVCYFDISKSTGRVLEKFSQRDCSMFTLEVNIEEISRECSEKKITCILMVENYFGTTREENVRDETILKNILGIM